VRLSAFLPVTWLGFAGCHIEDDTLVLNRPGLARSVAAAQRRMHVPASELDLDDLARIRLYANRALTAGAQDARAELLGTLLTTCAHCHAVLRDR
jgi:hypothetical protein